MAKVALLVFAKSYSLAILAFVMLISQLNAGVEPSCIHASKLILPQESSENFKGQPVFYREKVKLSSFLLAYHSSRMLASTSCFLFLFAFTKPFSVEFRQLELFYSEHSFPIFLSCLARKQQFQVFQFYFHLLEYLKKHFNETFYETLSHQLSSLSFKLEKEFYLMKDLSSSSVAQKFRHFSSVIQVYRNFSHSTEKHHHFSKPTFPISLNFTKHIWVTQ